MTIEVSDIFSPVLDREGDFSLNHINHNHLDPKFVFNRAHCPSDLTPSAFLNPLLAGLCLQVDYDLYML